MTQKLMYKYTKEGRTSQYRSVKPTIKKEEVVVVIDQD